MITIHRSNRDWFSHCSLLASRKRHNPGLLWVSVISFALASNAFAAIEYWDTSATTGIQGGTGTWDFGISANWNTSSSGANPLTPWVNGNDAYFTAGPNTVSISGTVTVGTLLHQTSTTLITNGVLQVSNVTANGGSLTIASAVTLRSSSSHRNAFTDYAPITITGNINEDAGSVETLRVLGNIGGVSLTLGGSNTFTGGIQIYQGASLVMTSPNAAGTGPILFGQTGQSSQSYLLTANLAANGIITNSLIFSGGTGQQMTVRSVGAGAATLGGNMLFNVQAGLSGLFGAVGPVSLNLGGTSLATNTYSGNIINSGSGINETSISKQDAGKWILAGANTYSGSTTVNDGTLLINGNNTAATGAVTVGVGGTLGGIGTIGGQTTINGTLSPGASVGTLTINSNLVLSGTSILNFELGTTSDQMVVNGDLSLGGTLNVIDAGGFGTGSYTLFLYTGALTNTGVTIGTMPGAGSSFSIDTSTAGQVKLVVGTCSGVDAAGPVSGPSLVNAPATGMMYSITNVSGATTYSWSVPSGAWISSGQGTTSIMVNYNGCSLSGNVTVIPSSTNGCSGTPSSLAVTVTSSTVFCDDFDAYTAGGVLPTGGLWSSAANSAPFATVVQQDSGNLFGETTANKYLKMAVTNATSSAVYYASINPLGTPLGTGNISFNFYQPSGAYSGTGFILRIGTAPGTNANTAFAVAIINGGLYQVGSIGVTPDTTPFASYDFNQKHALAIYFNNNLPSAAYEYTVDGTTYSVASGAMDVWLDGIRTAVALGKTGEPGGVHVALGAGLENFNFTSKGSFVGTLYIDDLSASGLAPLPAGGAPAGLTAAVNGNRVNLSWNPVVGAISYKVARGTASGGPYTDINKWIVEGGTNYTDVPPATGTYYYVVAANTSTVTTGPFSGQIMATTQAPVGAPGMITGLTASAWNTNRAVLSWTPVTGSAYATSYTVKRSTTNGGPYTTIVSGLTNANYVNTGLTNGTTYYYVVSGVNAIGEGSTATPVAVTPMPVPDGTISFADDWHVDPVKGKWDGLQAYSNPPRLYRDFQTSTWHGFPGVRVEVRPGDDPIGSSGERSEVSYFRNAQGALITEKTNTGTIYYGVSYSFPNDWVNSMTPGGSTWSIPLQLHGPDDGTGGSPAFAFYAGPRYRYQFFLNGGDLDSGGIGSKVSAYAQTYDLSDGGSMNLGTWTDFVIRIAYSANPEGSLTVWRRNQGQGAFTKVLDVANVRTLQYRSSISANVGAHYWKRGLYREENPTVTSILRMGPFVRGTSFAAVEWAAFGTTAGEATIPTNPTNLTFAVNGNNLTLSWPPDYVGWILQSQTNGLGTGISNNWSDVPGSGSSSNVVITINPASPTVFFRLRSP